MEQRIIHVICNRCWNKSSIFGHLLLIEIIQGFVKKHKQRWLRIPQKLEHNSGVICYVKEAALVE